MFSRWIRSGQGGRKARRALALRLGFETLEDRLTPSSLSYDEWRLQEFHVDDESIAVMGPLAATAQPVHKDFGSLIGLDRAFANHGYRGQGYSVAVIDTGIDYNHADLGGGWGNRVVAGYDFVNNDADPKDDNGHGTHVAGIIGSSSKTYSGVAPGVNLIALKVLDAGGNGKFGDVEAALKWVLNHRAQYNIVAVNLSLGSGNYSSNPYLFLEDELQTLRSQGVFLAVAAGNSFYSYSSQVGLAYPAVSQHAVSVGAVWSGNFGAVSWLSGARDNSTAADRIASFSQRSAALDVVAPGALITSTYKGGGYQSMAGTSMATPVVAGAAALVHQALVAAGQTANQDIILGILRSTGRSVNDGDDENDNVANTGLSFKRIDIGAALDSIGGSTPGNVVTPPNPTLAPLDNITMPRNRRGRVTLDVGGAALTFTAKALPRNWRAYQLDQALNLTYKGSYFTNAWGLGEKWLATPNPAGPQDWYCLLPNGELRRHGGSAAGILAETSLIAKLEPIYYAQPQLLWDVQLQAAPPVTFKIAGNELRIKPPRDYVGTFYVEVAASDGHSISKRHIRPNRVRAAPPGPLRRGR
jgi:subtilisin family serine protease